MEESTFKLLTSFIVKGRKLAGPIDSDRLLKDGAYAREIFRRIEDEGDEDLVLLSLKLRDLLGPPAAAPVAEEAPAKDAATKLGDKYKFGARS
jgi:hypothetical protein